jgi:hypothetical protein
MIWLMKRAALAVLAGLLLAACGSSSSSTTTPAHTTGTTSTAGSTTTWHGLKSVRVTVAQPGLPPPYGGPSTISFTTPQRLAQATAALNRYRISQRVPASESHGCAGGKQITIAIVRLSGQHLTLNAYRCGGQTTGGVDGDLTGFMSALGMPL